MKITNIKIATVLNNETTDFEFSEGTIAIDPTGFLVVEKEGQRTFFSLDTIYRWGYDYADEESKETGKLLSFTKPDSVN